MAILKAKMRRIDKRTEKAKTKPPCKKEKKKMLLSSLMELFLPGSCFNVPLVLINV